MRSLMAGPTEAFQIAFNILPEQPPVCLVVYFNLPSRTAPLTEPASNTGKFLLALSGPFRASKVLQVTIMPPPMPGLPLAVMDQQVEAEIPKRQRDYPVHGFSSLCGTPSPAATPINQNPTVFLISPPCIQQTKPTHRNTS